MLACSTWNKEIIEFAKENLNVHKRPHFSKYTYTHTHTLQGKLLLGSTSLHIFIATGKWDETYFNFNLFYLNYFLTPGAKKFNQPARFINDDVDAHALKRKSKLFKSFQKSIKIKHSLDFNSIFY